MATSFETPRDPQLDSINKFIAETDLLTRQQLAWLNFSENWHSPEDHAALDQGVQQTIHDNVNLIKNVALELSGEGKRLSALNPGTQLPVPLLGIGYSTLTPGYEVCIPGPEPVVVPLVGELRIDHGPF